MPEKRFSLSVIELSADWQKYDKHLGFQRESVWPLSKERMFIEGILRGYHIPEFPVVQMEDGFAIVDGKQRFWALRRFMEDGFTTFKEKQNPPYGSIDPKKLYSQLPPHLKMRIDNAILSFYVIDETEEWVRADYYRWLQYHQPLLLSEKIWTYPSETKNRAIQLLDHDFWSEIYHGNRSRMRPFLGCYYLMLIEVSSSEVNITDRRLREFGSGSDDSLVNNALLEKLSNELNAVTYVFWGTSLKDIKEVIPVREAVSVLESANIIPLNLKRGCLTSWYRQVQEKALGERQTYGITSDLFRMNYVRYRQKFRDEQGEEIIKAATSAEERGLEKMPYPIDPELVVERQRGLCPLCDRNIKNVFGGDYVIQYKKDSPITVDNCVVVHSECNEKLEASMPHLGLASIELKN